MHGEPPWFGTFFPPLRNFTTLGVGKLVLIRPFSLRISVLATASLKFMRMGLCTTSFCGRVCDWEPDADGIALRCIGGLGRTPREGMSARLRSASDLLSVPSNPLVSSGPYVSGSVASSSVTLWGLRGKHLSKKKKKKKGRGGAAAAAAGTSSVSSGCERRFSGKIGICGGRWMTQRRIRNADFSCRLERGAMRVLVH